MHQAQRLGERQQAAPVPDGVRQRVGQVAERVQDHGDGCLDLPGLELGGGRVDRDELVGVGLRVLHVDDVVEQQVVGVHELTLVAELVDRPAEQTEPAGQLVGQPLLVLAKNVSFRVPVPSVTVTSRRLILRLPRGG